MLKRGCKFLSVVLVFALLLQMVPLQSLALDYRVRQSNKITLPEISATETLPSEPEEVPAKRTAYSKEYRTADGQNMAVVYPVDVHYETENGWEEIDNTLKLTEGKYTNTAGLWEVALPQQLSKDSRISISKDGYTLRFGMAGQLRLDDSVAVMSADAQSSTKAEPMTASQAQVTPKKLLSADTPAHMAILSQKNSSQLSYAGVYQNTDVIYDLQGNKVKESIVLASYDSDLVGYRYVLEVGALNPVLNEDGSICFYDADNKDIVMVMQAPFLIDDNGEQTDDIQVTLTGKEGTYYLTYTLPRQWLAQEERAFPVILDPFVTPSLRYYNIMDVTVGDVASSSWNWAINEVGYISARGVQRVYLKFNELPEITSADVITHAQIQMYKPYTFTRSAAVEVHKVLETWEEYGMTWATKPDISNTVEDYNIIREEGNYIWEITDIARDWYVGGNTGMLFKTTDEAEAARTNNWYQFHASDMGDDSIVLIITYRNNTGLESYWDYSSFSAGRAGTGYVNNFTGNLTWTRADLGFGGTRAAVAISHVYNANDADNDLYGAGYGWRTSYNQRVYQWSENPDYYVWEDGDGTQHYFYKESTGAYKDEDGLELVLETTGSGNSKYTITDKVGNVSHFDTKGRLTQIVNNQATPSPVTVTYTTTSGYRIDTVTDAIGRRYVYTYENDLLTKIEAQNSVRQHLTHVTYGYTNGLLTSITDKDGETVSYTYSGEKLLTEAEDIDGYRLAISYNTTTEGAVRRVATVSEFDGDTAGGTLTFTYAQNQTTIEDYSGNQTIYQFNNWGNTVSVQDGEGRAQFAEYATDTDENGKGNQLTAASKLQNTVTNLLENGSFETGLPWQNYPSYPYATISTTHAYHGNKSTEIDCEEGTYLLGNPLAVAPGETYTLSAYIKLLSGTAQLGFDTGSSYSCVGSEILTPSDEWQRVQVSYTAPLQGNHADPGPVIALTGHGYVDCVQLEKSPTASRYNLIDNGDFTDTGGWTGTGLATEDGISSPAEAVSWLSGNAYKIAGDPNTAKSASQTVAVSGGEGDTFVLAGWAQGDGVPLENGKDQRGRTFGLKAVFHYTDGTSSEPKTVSFNPDTPYWQYAALPLVAEKAYSSVTVTAEYAYGMNTVYFDGIGLYKEQFSSSYTYDEDGNVTSVTDLQEKTTTYEYQNNNLTHEILPDNTEMTYTYDNYHNVLTATSSAGLVYTFTYDTYGNNTSVSISDGEKTLTTSATYNSEGNAIETATDSTGNVTTYHYNVFTNVLEWVQYPEDSETTKTVYTYDEMYRTAKAAIGESVPLQEVEYTYTDDLLTQVATKTTEYTFDYGDFGLRSNVKIGSWTLASYEYEEGTNRLTKLLYGNNDWVSHIYDTQGRVMKDTYEDGDTVSYLYDNSGSLASVIDSGSGITTTYYYDFIDRPAKYTEKGTNYSHSVEYGYDAENNMSSLKETINGTLRTTAYSYDADNRLDTITANGNTVDYTYDDFGRIQQKVIRSGTEVVLTTTYTYYDPTETTTSTQVKSIQQTAGNYSVTYTYTYDKNGNILLVDNGTATVQYLYTDTNQLYETRDQIAGMIQALRYTDLDRPFVELAVLDGEQTTIEYGWDATWGDMLTRYGDRTLTYDNIGNMTSDGTYTYTWEHGRELSTMADSTGTWAFTYDANGMRTKKAKTNTSGTATDTYAYVYNGSQLSQMTKNGNVLNFFYDGEGRPAYFTYGSATYYYVTNLQGDVIAILDSMGNVMVNYHYDAYGVLLQTGGTMAATLGTLNPLTYRGYVYDHETGLYYLQSRYYMPSIRNWISPEPNVYAGGFDSGSGLIGYNVYAYCANNPVNFSDPTGEYILTALIIGVVAGAVIGGAIGGTVAYNSAKSSGLEGSDLFWATAGGVGKGALIGGVAGGLVGATGGVVAAYGATSVAGTAMITATATITAKATEVTALQAKKGTNDGDNGWQIANDCIDSVFSNGGKIISPALTKAGTTSATYVATDLIKHKVVPLGFNTFLHSAGGKVLPYGFAAYAWGHTAYSIFCTDPIVRANQRGYGLR